MKANLYLVEVQKEMRQMLYASEVLFKCGGRLVQLWLKLQWLLLNQLSVLFLVRPKLIKRIDPNHHEVLDDCNYFAARNFPPPNFKLYR